MNIDFQGKSFPSRITVELPDVLFRCSDPTHAQVGARELVCQVKFFNYNLFVGSNLAMTLQIHLIRKMLRFKIKPRWSTMINFDLGLVRMVLGHLLCQDVQSLSWYIYICHVIIYYYQLWPGFGQDGSWSSPLPRCSVIIIIYMSCHYILSL